MRPLPLSWIVAATMSVPPATFTGTIIDNDCAGLGHASRRIEVESIAPAK